jgi:hypothetical protein
MQYVLAWIWVALCALLSWVPLAQATTPDQMPANSWLSIPNSKMMSVAPANGQFAGTWGNVGPRAVVGAWGGAALDTKRNHLVLWGGGHNDYYGNELYAFDIATLKWQRLTDPTINPQPYIEKQADGRPTARHTYGGLAYIAHADKFFSHSGARSGGSSPSPATWSFDFNTLQWTQKHSNIFGALEITSAYDPVTGKVWVGSNSSAIAGSAGLWSYSYDTNTWTRHNSDSFKKHAATVDTKRGLLVVVGNGEIFSYDIRNGNYTKELWTTTGGDGFLSLGYVYPKGFDYDPIADRLVGWAGGAVYALNPATKQWTAYNPPGAPAPTKTGIFGRWRYVPSVNAFILVTSAEEDVQFYKLSAGEGTAPPVTTITAPAEGTVFTPGQTVTAQGTGTNLSWSIDRTGDGLAPFTTGSGSSLTFTVPANATSAQTINIKLAGSGGGDEQTHSISGSTAPAPAPAPAPQPIPVTSITAPTEGTVLSPGQTVTVQGSGSNLSWSVDRIGDGLPAFASGTGTSFSFTVPASSTSSQTIVISLTATGGSDSQTHNISTSELEPAPAPAPAPSPTPAPVNPNEDILTTWTEDTTRIYYNQAQRLIWANNLGDWRDADGIAQGTKPFASVAVVDTNVEQVVNIDVTALVVKHGASMRINRSGGTSFTFHSREASNSSKRPVLMVTKNGVTTPLQAVADASMNASSLYSGGSSATLSTASGFMIRFGQKADSTIQKAVLRLTATATQYGNQTLNVFKPDPHPVFPQVPALALGSSADIVMKLQGNAWLASMDSGDKANNKVQADGSLIGAVPTGSDTGLSVDWGIPREARQPEMFMRTVMKLHMNFDPDWSGKMPGLANTGHVDNRSITCGGGGATANGTCWSARTFFGSTPNSLFGKDYLQFGAYAYRVNHVTLHGDGPDFVLPIKRERFFVMDQRVKLNSIKADGTAAADGELTYWLDGKCVLHWTGIIWRTNAGADTLPSEVWGNIYVGGTGYQAPHPHGYTLHSITVSKRLLPFDATVLDALN